MRNHQRTYQQRHGNSQTNCWHWHSHQTSEVKWSPADSLHHKQLSEMRRNRAATPNIDQYVLFELLLCFFFFYVCIVTHRDNGEGSVDHSGTDGCINRLRNSCLLKDSSGVVENLKIMKCHQLSCSLCHFFDLLTLHRQEMHNIFKSFILTWSD